MTSNPWQLDKDMVPTTKREALVGLYSRGVLDEVALAPQEPDMKNSEANLQEIYACLVKFEISQDVSNKMSSPTTLVVRPGLLNVSVASSISAPYACARAPK